LGYAVCYKYRKQRGLIRKTQFNATKLRSARNYAEIKRHL